MRDVYHQGLDEVGRDLARLARLTGAALRGANTALLGPDLQAAETVIVGDRAVDTLRAWLDDRALDLMARQQPVAGDLRVLVASLRMSADLERMGDLAVHIAKVARRRYPSCAVPDDLRDTIDVMGVVGVHLADTVAELIEGRDVPGARRVEEQDDVVDQLHRELYSAILQPGRDWPMETAIDLTLVGRYYERFADHVVSVARRLEFVVTGTNQRGE
ncbi:phosphate signaling complex protein PhoU [Catenulispora rubra]|uniref:phosphate signaling complex protein PhoU n=1 Tax=Catenulispora rubra TaxID=280293 RepID=UPI0018924A12|nr:phosphate signaling complex protein PhoU [Catenulispora rubra]